MSRIFLISLMAAEVPIRQPDVLIVESTYGSTKHASKVEREECFTGFVRKVVQRQGKCLVPVFATGRAQELLLILNEFWENNKELQGVPIYYASKTAAKALKVYQTFIHMMNRHIQGLMDVCNPFRFKFIKNLEQRGQEFDSNDEVCVVVAAPGMLQVRE